MRRLIFIPVLSIVLAAGSLVLTAGELPESVSKNYRLSRLTPNGGQARMSSQRFRMEAVLSPIPSCKMSSDRYQIRPLDAPLRSTPDIARYAAGDSHINSGDRVVLILW